MKSIQEIKDLVARRNGYVRWEEVVLQNLISDKLVSEVMEEVWGRVRTATVDYICENVTLSLQSYEPEDGDEEDEDDDEGFGTFINVDMESIRNANYCEELNCK